MQISSDTYFTYDGHESYLYGLRFAWIENSPETNMVSEKNYSQIKNNSLNNFRVAKTSYEEALQFEAEMSSDRVLLDAEVRRIYSKFFDKNQYKILRLPVDGENINLNCVFTNVQKLEGGYDDRYGVVGFRVTILCDAPWGWTDDIEVTPEIDENGKFTIRNRSDSQDYIYPEVTVLVPSGSDVSSATKIGNIYSCLGCPLISICQGISAEYPFYMTDEEISTYPIISGQGNTQTPKKAMIINETDDELRGTCFLCKASEAQTIIMDPKTGTIVGTTGNSFDRENKVAMTNKKFIRLVPGDNTFYTENLGYEQGEDPTITLKYKEARILV